MKTQGLFHDVIDCCMWRLFASGLRACCLCLQKIACLLSFVALNFAKASYNIVFYFLMMKSNFSVTYSSFQFVRNLKVSTNIYSNEGLFFFLDTDCQNNGCSFNLQ